MHCGCCYFFRALGMHGHLDLFRLTAAVCFSKNLFFPRLYLALFPPTRTRIVHSQQWRACPHWLAPFYLVSFSATRHFDVVSFILFQDSCRLPCTSLPTSLFCKTKLTGKLIRRLARNAKQAEKCRRSVPDLRAAKKLSCHANTKKRDFFGDSVPSSLLKCGEAKKREKA